VAFRLWVEGWGHAFFQPQRKAFFNFKVSGGLSFFVASGLTVEGDAEAQEYAQQIANAFKAAGLETTEATVVDKWPNLDPGGAHVVIPDSTRPATGATQLQNALLKAGVAVDLISDPVMRSDRTQVLIGHDTR
jgi:hypothetical protein